MDKKISDEHFKQIVINALPKEILPVRFSVSAKNGWGLLKIKYLGGGKEFARMAAIISERLGGKYQPKRNLFVIPRPEG